MKATTTIGIACIAIAALLGCEKSKKPEAGKEEIKDGHQSGLANAEAMVENAKRCEPASGSGDVAACKRACQLNHSNSCANWGSLVETADRERARELYDRSCTGGSGIGCESLARLSQEDGSPASDAQYLSARRYHRVHCGQGYGRSCSQLATLFEQGRGGDIDKATGQSYRQRACQLGVSSDC